MFKMLETLEMRKKEPQKLLPFSMGQSPLPTLAKHWCDRGHEGLQIGGFCFLQKFVFAHRKKHIELRLPISNVFVELGL